MIFIYSRIYLTVIKLLKTSKSKNLQSKEKPNKFPFDYGFEVNPHYSKTTFTLASKTQEYDDMYNCFTCVII